MGRTLDQIIQNEKPAVVVKARAKAQEMLKELKKKDKPRTDPSAPNSGPEAPLSSDE
jgi:hypothetical protein